jgi:hypothetical protein
MAVAQDGQAETREAAEEQEATGARRRLLAAAIPFTLIAGVLVVRNWFLFSTRLYEVGDMASDSIRIEQARHFQLLIGIYSRLQFNHPGPAYLYVQAWGEELFYNLLHVVPTAWNGQLFGVYALNALFGALAVDVVYRWAGARGATAALAALLTFLAIHPLTASSDWMPYLNVLTYITFLVAASSVAAGRAGDMWIATVTGWFLIHGHTTFLLFVPVVAGVTVVIALWPHRGNLRADIRRFIARRRKAWVPVLVLSALFLLPMVLNMVLNWPGDFVKYLEYSSSAGYSWKTVFRYALWFWWPSRSAWLALLVTAALWAAAGAAVWRLATGRVRQFLVAMLALNVVSSVTFAYFVTADVDTLASHYEGYFYWSAPAVTVLVIAVAVASRLSARVGAAVTAIACLAALAAFAVAPYARSNTALTDPAVPSMAPDTDPGIATAVQVLAARSPGRVLVINLDHNTWRDVTGFLVQAQRSGVRACVNNPWWTFMVTSQFICSQHEIATGAHYWFHEGGVPRGLPILVKLYAATVTPGPAS